MCVCMYMYILRREIHIISVRMHTFPYMCIHRIRTYHPDGSLITWNVRMHTSLYICIHCTSTCHPDGNNSTLLLVEGLCEGTHAKHTTRVYIRINLCVYMCMCTCINVYVYSYIYIYMYMYMYICTHAYIHTHIHIHA